MTSIDVVSMIIERLEALGFIFTEDVDDAEIMTALAQVEFVWNGHVNEDTGAQGSLFELEDDEASGDIFPCGLHAGDVINIKIDGARSILAGTIVEIEYLDGEDGEVEAARIVLANGWKGIAKLEEIS